MPDTLYYHFTGDILRDGKPVPRKGRWLTFRGDPIPCECGLHASPDPFDALQYAPGAKIHQVLLGGKIVPHGNPVDKFAAQKRKIVASIDATDILRLFARRVALDVIHLWSAPPIVKEYLETGDESKRAAAAAAWDAARAAAWDAAWDAARAAAWAAAWDAARNAARNAARAAAWAAARDAARAAAWDAAWDAARAAAWDAARAAAWDAAWAAAWDAAWAAAWDAAWDAARAAAKQKLYRGWFNEMVYAAFAEKAKRDA